MRIKAWHPASGNTMSAEVVAVTGAAPHRSFRVIPDGLLEQVILREGTWSVVLDEGDWPRAFNEGAVAGMKLATEAVTRSRP